jgi:hypothetical protein
VVEELRQSGSSELVTLEGLKMFSLGNFPGVVITDDPADRIVAEIIDGTLSAEKEETLNYRLDGIEGIRYDKDGNDIGLYKRVMWETSKGPALIYVFNKKIPEDTPAIIDWIKWISDDEKIMEAGE